MLGYRLHADWQRVSELRDRGLALGEAIEHRSSRRIRERCEGFRELIRGHLASQGIALASMCLNSVSLSSDNQSRRHHMGRIVVTEYISIDGVIEAPGGDEDYEHVNWVFEFE